MGDVSLEEREENWGNCDIIWPEQLIVCCCNDFEIARISSEPPEPEFVAGEGDFDVVENDEDGTVAAALAIAIFTVVSNKNY